jgi:hypothetical protein
MHLPGDQAWQKPQIDDPIAQMGLYIKITEIKSISKQ